MDHYERFVDIGTRGIIIIAIAFAVVTVWSDLGKENPRSANIYIPLILVAFSCFEVAMFLQRGRFFKWLASVGCVILGFLFFSGLIFLVWPAYAASAGILAAVFLATLIIWKELAV